MIPMILDSIAQNCFDQYCKENKDPFENKQELINYFSKTDGFLDQLNVLERDLNLFEELYSQRRLYRRFSQIKEGKKRDFAVPHPIFKEFLSHYIIPIIKNIETHPRCHGGEKGWSTRKSLEQHLPLSSVFSLDLKDAFNNVTIRHVFEYFYKATEDVKVSGSLSFLTTVTYNGKRSLPQGSPHSMALYNRILHCLDCSIDKKCDDRKFIYTRWVDDFTISSKTQIPLESFIGVIPLVENYFDVARDKTFYQTIDKTIYLLGHKITDDRLEKNSKEERKQNKSNSIDYGSFFGDNPSMKYVEW